jgi:hypothetical protein
VTALLDQAAAATAEGEKILAVLAAMDGTPVRHTRPGPMFGAIIGRFRNRALAGQLTLCPHLSWTAPAPAFWCAWAPGRLRCATCAQATHKRIRGTREDRRCDRCRRVVQRIHADTVQLPSVVVDLPSPKCIPPVMVMFGLCPACQHAERTAA